MSKWKLVNPEGLLEWHQDRLDVAAAFRGDGIEAVEGWIAARHRKAFDREVGRLVAAGVGKDGLEEEARHLGAYEVVEGTPPVRGWVIDKLFREAGGRLVAFAPDDGHETAFAARLGLPGHARPFEEIHEMMVAEVPRR